MKYLNKDDHDPDKFANRLLVAQLIFVIAVLAVSLFLSIVLHLN